VWSVWSERVDIYLGRNLAMARLRGGPTTLIEHPPTWPLQRVLERVASTWQSQLTNALPSNGNTKRVFDRKKLQLHITLGSSRCHSGTFVVPKGVQKYVELQSLAVAAAMQSGSAQTIMSEIDPFYPGIMSSIGAHFLGNLNAWAKSQGASISSLRPLWSVATQCAMIRQKNITGLALSEPDGITLLACPDTGLPEIKSTNLMTIDLSNLGVQASPQTILVEEPVQLQMRRWKIANDLQDENLLTLMFIPSGSSIRRGLPKTWDGHWSWA